MFAGDIPSSQRGPAVAIETQDRTWSYAELDDLANGFAAAFRGHGLQHGDRVSFIMDNDALLVGAYFGAFRAGLVANPINNRLLPEELAYIIDHAGSRCIVVAEEFAPLVARTLPLLKSAPLLMKAQDAPLAPTLSEHRRPFSPAAGDDGALLIYTSGTTGKPKGVLLTQSNVMAAAAIVSRAFAMQAGQRTLCVMPLFHTNGLMFSTLPFLLAGATVVLRRRFSASAFWTQCRDSRATTSSVSPTILAMLLEHEAQAPAAADIHLDYIKVASAPTSVELAERFEARFGRGLLLETYGLTETTAISTMNPLRGRRRHGSIGMALAPQQVRIVDEAGNCAPAGVTGELEVRGPTVMKEYFRDAHNTRETIHDGWLRSGDIARKDADGFFFIVGRSKEMILRGGENISPLEIEQVAAGHPAVREVAAVGVPDRIWGEVVGLCVVARQAVGAHELIEYCRTRLSDFKAPQHVIFVEALPRNAVGKVTRSALRGAFPGN